MILLIAQTMPNWPLFVKTIDECLGRSPTRSLDADKRPVGDLVSYVAALAEFDKEGTSLNSALSQESEVFDHVSISLFTVVDSRLICDIFINTNLRLLVQKVDDEQTAIILTGTLKQWKEAVRLNTLSHRSKKVKVFYTEVQKTLTKHGFSEVFQRRIDG